MHIQGVQRELDTARGHRTPLTGSLSIPSLNITVSHQFVNVTCPARGIFYLSSTYRLSLMDYAGRAQKTGVCVPPRSLKAEDTQPIKQGTSQALLQPLSLTGSQSTSQPRPQRVPAWGGTWGVPSPFTGGASEAPPHKHPSPSSSVTGQGQRPGSRHPSQRHTNLPIPSAKEHVGLGAFLAFTNRWTKIGEAG